MNSAEPAHHTDDEALLTAAEVAHLLAVRESWIREETRRGHLPHLQLGRYIRYRRHSILDWLDSQETTGPTPHRGNRRAAR